MSDQFTVVFVCAANLCRSVTAAALTERRLQEVGVEWTIKSAGLDVRPGASLPPATAQTMLDHGIALNPRPRALDEGLIAQSDLVLTAEQSQRSRIVRRCPAANVKVFTIKQFARFCAAGRADSGVDGSVSGDDLLELAARGHGLVQPVPTAEDDIADPVRARSRSAMSACIDTLSEAVREIVGS